MIYSTDQSPHWKLNQSEVAISGRLANQIERIEPIRSRYFRPINQSEARKKEQNVAKGCSLRRPRPITFYEVVL